MDFQNFQPNQANLGRILLSSIFVITGIKSAMNFQQMTGMIAGKNLPFPQILAGIALAFKLLGGLSVFTNYQVNYGRWMLVAFTLAATVLYHNPINDPSQLNAALRNTGIIGGLLLL